MKHFVGYPNPRSGHDRGPEWIPDRMLYQYYVPSFYAAVQAGVTTAMESYNELNNIPMVSSSQYLKDLLRETLNFTGMLVTDWREIENLHDWHRTAESQEEAVRIAMQRTSIDMSMVPSDTSFAELLHTLVQSGVVPESRVDESLIRILRWKHALGLLEAHHSDSPTPDDDVRRPGHADDRRVALDAARESIVLLRNTNDMLPLQADRMSKLLVTGPCADSLSYLAGGWTLHWQGAIDDDEFRFGATLLAGIVERARAHNQWLVVEHVPACHVNNKTCDAATLSKVRLPEKEQL
jgi:beta-glucosidase